ncbi:MAG: pimeloyl-ACP methyl ester carboxylesterase [Halieaceae bacterium]
MVEFERLAVRGSNCELSAVDFGGRGKPDLIVLHGTHDHALGLYPAIAELLDDYHVVGLDLRGHGHSEKPGNYTMLAMVADLRALVDGLGLIRPTLVVHSLGGPIAARYAAIYPDDVSALVMLDGMGPPRLSEAPLALAAGLRSGVDGALRPTSEARRMADRDAALARFRSNYPALDAECAALIVDNGIADHPKGGVRWRFDPAINLIFHTFSDRDAQAMVSLIECPVLLVSGDGALDFWRRMGLAGDLDEAAFEAEQGRRCALFANARRGLVAGAGHMLHYDQPVAVRGLLRDFLLA